VSTPGRLLRAVYGSGADLTGVSYLILDEADHLLHLGFALQVAALCSQIRPDRQACMFSATWMQDVRALAKQVLAHPLKVVVNDVASGLANPRIQQHVLVVDRPHHKLPCLRALLADLLLPDAAVTRTFIFVQRRRRVHSVAAALQKTYGGVGAYSADLPQDQREANLSAFRADPRGILVCTDVASHGLDVEDVRFVVNYDLPAEFTQYVHRIGRTARAGRSGAAYSLYHHATDWPLVRRLIRCIRTAGQPVPDQLYAFAKTTHSMGLPRGPGRLQGPKRVRWLSQSPPD